MKIKFLFFRNIFYSEKNYTKGSLCATAYRTLGTEDWNFKYYRYDARGRVKKMWNYISGLGMKVTYYYYNSQNQLIMLKYQITNDNDYRAYYFNYDKAGRLQSVSTDQSGPPPDYLVPFAEYRYNQNSQIDSVFYNNGSYYITNNYNNRNWVTQSSSSNNKLNYMLDYLANGNIGSQYINGDYKGYFSDTKEFRVNYEYDNSNRLTEVERFSTKYFDMSGIFTYDSDGNFLTLTRSYNSDNFSYDYYSGTNKLKKVSGSTDQFTYDYNGNLKNDYFNNNTDIKYDHRNLITEITRINELEDPPATYITSYKYDEAGNRINKKVLKDDGSTMEIIVNEYYIRDISGKEIAIYQNDTLKFWNVWGLGNEGRITADGIRYYYIKDHLGSIRAVLNDNNELVEAIDYDAWGHIARYWSSTSSKYKFTGKERDNETGYDYGVYPDTFLIGRARYYDARIGRWGQTDPVFQQYISTSPYCYGLNIPIFLIDPNGKEIDPSFMMSYDYANKTNYTNTWLSNLMYLSGLKLEIINDRVVYDKISEPKSGSETVREMLISLIESPEILSVMIIDNISSKGEKGGLMVSLNPNQIKEFMIASEKAGLNESTLGWGFVFLHETSHTKVGMNLHDPIDFGIPGLIENTLNNARAELSNLGYGEFGYRASYSPKRNPDNNLMYLPFSLFSMNELKKGNFVTKFTLIFKPEYLQTITR